MRKSHANDMVLMQQAIVDDAYRVFKLLKELKFEPNWATYYKLYDPTLVVQTHHTIMVEDST